MGYPSAEHSFSVWLTRLVLNRYSLACPYVQRLTSVYQFYSLITASKKVERVSSASRNLWHSAGNEEYFKILFYTIGTHVDEISLRV